MSSSAPIMLGLVAAAIGAGLTFTTVLLAPSWKSLLLTSLAAATTLVIFVTTRHVQLLSRRCPKRQAKLQRDKKAIPRQPLEYCLFVLGSGGHTKEMLMMMDDGFCDFAGFHRRYLLSSGDSMSENHLADYERDLARLCRQRKTSPGSFDTHVVTRARRIYQPLWSTPLTALLSVLDILPALLRPPRNDVGRRLRYPGRIFSNGPATGFFVALAAHLLKMFYLVPEDSMKFVYVESWARISTLSLTGRLLYHTGIADVFLTQHEQVAARYGVQNAGEVVFNSRRVDGA